MAEYHAKNVQETKDVARHIAADILSAKKRKRAVVLALYGDLGSGKTHFAQAVAEALGIKETVPSPTFIIVRAYEIKKVPYTKFVHIDAYRLKDENELHQIGWDEMVQDPRNIILVEWADNIERALPADAIKIWFTHISENERKIMIKI